MDRAVRYGLSVLVFLFAAATQAEVLAAPIKVGYVNSVALMEQAPQADIAKHALEREFSPREREIRALQQQAQTLQGRLDNGGASMGDTERSTLRQQLDQKMLRIQQMQSDFQDDLNLKKNEALGKLQQAVLQAIKDVAKTNGYQLVLSDGVVYAAPSVDITKLVAERLKQLAKGKQ
ncbi:OmpH family outer membrane protein [Halothiobacillus neapolitanus]|uniref:Outer membrane chaperone Skp (OmpH) n=1 Tax=Halothiobacillus neapolitanus (strain ATCC 23641 / DSM 15147 / CIP 104769 / NCIMB 8539 / c2) TaxID=555778 RepID=D0KVZ9_HALNC|nr:OmpH family outer membrane protein [Halothiobacillus neapolitanus]ACX94926.1 outer membrane chaperone Skp (OmpH) [Halothiobacillus neapolitanus c2]TDN60418.1 periplasmic chaperone for outer membrane proteins Skp [Halothiobacillus neapolitanus]